MASILVESARSVADALNRQSWLAPYKAKASNRPRIASEDVHQSGRSLDVVPGGIAWTSESRGSALLSVDVHIVLRTAATMNEDEAVVASLEKAESIERFLVETDFDKTMRCTGTNREVPFALDELDQVGICTVVITATLKWRGG